MATRTRNTSNRAPPALPLDIRAMNAAALAVFALAGLVLLAATIAWLLRAQVFTLRSISLDGDLNRSNLATVRANAVPRLAGNFFSFDLERGRVAFESVPWVRQAVVRRVWPNRLAVTLEEHRAVALWAGDANNEKLVNAQGEVFEANLGDVEDENLITLAGPEGTSAQMLALQQRLAQTLVPLNARIDTLRLSSRGSWHIELEGGTELELGRGSADEVLARTERFVRTLARATQRFGKTSRPCSRSSPASRSRPARRHSSPPRPRRGRSPSW